MIEGKGNIVSSFSLVDLHSVFAKPRVRGLHLEDLNQWDRIT